MNHLTQDFWENWDDYMSTDKPYWQISLSAAGENDKITELKGINVNPAPEDSLGILLYQMQQAVLSLDTSLQAQQEQIAVLVTYLKHTRKQNAELQKKLDTLSK